MKVGEIALNTSLAIAKQRSLCSYTWSINSSTDNRINQNQCSTSNCHCISSINSKVCKGTMNAPEGLAVVGERGTELKITPKVRQFTPSTASLDYLEKGLRLYQISDLVDMINEYSTLRLLTRVYQSRTMIFLLQMLYWS